MPIAVAFAKRISVVGFDLNAAKIDLYKKGIDPTREVEKIAQAMTSEAKEGLEELLWSTLTAFEGYPFRTAKGLRFHYSIKGNEIFFSRKEKSVTRATANIALENAVKLQKEGFVITGPKMLRCFGASYLYPVFIRIGVIQNGDKRI